jgi:hypothetical protein
MDFGGCYYMTFKLEGTTGDELLRRVCSDISARGIDTSALVGDGEAPQFDKYDPCVPPELLRQAFEADHLRTEEIIERARLGIL